MTDKNIVIVGAGVAGLTTALLLSKNPDYKITVVAKHMPGDYDIEYASPWAGADYLPTSTEGTDEAKWDKNTWPYLYDLASNHPEAGIHFQRTEIQTRKKDVGSSNPKFTHNPWWKALFPDFQPVPQHLLLPTIAQASTFTSVCIKTALYLPYLASCNLAAGVTLKRVVLSHISDAASPEVYFPEAHSSHAPADIVINCTGLASRYLGGVNDKAMIPVRGQIVLVRNDPGGTFSLSGTDDGPDERCYIMKRAAGGGTILGGTYQEGREESVFDPNLAMRIMKRAVDVCPALVADEEGVTNGRGIEHLDIIRHGVGVRPVRKGGARIEKELIGGIWVVHNYGHGGAGYQSSYGCAEEVVGLVDGILAEDGNGGRASGGEDGGNGANGIASGTWYSLWRGRGKQ